MSASQEAFFPKSDADFLVWYGNFLSKLVLYKNIFSFTDADITPLQTDFAALTWLNNAIDQLKNDGKEFTAYRDAIANGDLSSPVFGFPLINPLPTPPANTTPGAIGRLRAMVRRIKASPAYSEPVGRDLGIVRTKPVPPQTPNRRAVWPRR